MMLLNDVPEGKKLAYLLGFHVERPGFSNQMRLPTTKVAAKVAVLVTGLLLLSFLWTVGFEWR